jgi:glycosyltransferase involved in cell wall biosynthesis
MRILFINHVGYLGGGEKSMLTLMEGLRDKKGHQVVLLAPQGELLGIAGKLGFEIYGYDFENVRRSWNPFILIRGAVRFWQGAAIIEKIIKDGRFQVVHANSLKSAIMGGRAARRAGIPLVFHTRDFLNAGLLGKWLVAWAYRLSSHIIVNSRSVAELYGSRGTDKISVVYNSIDLPPGYSSKSKADIKNKVGFDPASPVIGFVGRVHPDKGIETLLRGFKIMRDADPQLRLWLVGGPMPGEEHYLEKLKLEAVNLGIANDACFLGWRQDAVELMSGMDLLVVPSKKEPFGRVTVEAMLLGVPVIATASGGTLEIVDDLQTGLLFPPNDDQALARCALRLLGDKELCEKLTVEARLTASGKFGHDQYINGVQRVYDTLAW